MKNGELSPGYVECNMTASMGTDFFTPIFLGLSKDYLGRFCYLTEKHPANYPALYTGKDAKMEQPILAVTFVNC